MTNTAENADDDWHAASYRQHAGFVADLAADLLEWLAPASGERILDIGCGDGALSERIMAAGTRVTGLDASPDMAEAARRRGLDVVTGDAQQLATLEKAGHAYDAVFSNAALHWMNSDPQSVIEQVLARLKPGGRFVAEMGGDGNIAPIRAALRAEAELAGLEPDRIDPWYFPTETAYIDRLTHAGFHIERSHCFDRPTELPGDVADWLTTLARPFVTAFAEGQARDAYIEAVRNRLLGEIYHHDGQWVAPYVRLRFMARKPDTHGAAQGLL